MEPRDAGRREVGGARAGEGEVGTPGILHIRGQETTGTPNGCDSRQATSSFTGGSQGGVSVRAWCGPWWTCGVLMSQGTAGCTRAGAAPVLLPGGA